MGTMAQAFVGKFKLASQENFDEYKSHRCWHGQACPGPCRHSSGHLRAQRKRNHHHHHLEKITFPNTPSELKPRRRPSTAAKPCPSSPWRAANSSRRNGDGKTATLTYELGSNGLVVTIQLDSITCVRKYTRM